MNYLKYIFLTLIFCTSVLSAEEKKVTDYVNTFIGTSNYGTTNPGALCPNGMMSVTPFNVMGSDTNRWDKDSRWWSTPYSSDNTFLTGFSHVNLSGVGCPEVALALTMLFSLFPAVSAEGEAKPNNISVTYDIAKYLAEYGFGWASRPDYSTIDYAVTNGFFSIVHCSEDKFVGQAYNGVGTAGADPKYIRLKKGNHISFELNVPMSGTYTLKADFPKGSSGGDTNVYVTDKETFDAQASFAIANLGNAGKSTYNCASNDGLAFGRTDWMNATTIIEELQLS